LLIIARHGQTQANADRRLLGRADVPLTELGRAQAAAMAAVARPKRVISSPLQRCRDTAAAFGVPVEIDERWIEVDYGIYDEVPIADVPADVWRQWRSDPTFVPDGGESMAAVGERVRAACADLLPDAAGDDDIVVVSHVSPIKAAVAWSLGHGDELVGRLFLDVAAVSRIGVSPIGATVLRSFNDTSHLHGLA
jgi:broad specificity phosphatase PhoE